MFIGPRNFAVLLLVIFSGFALLPAQAQDYDVVILNGRVMDPATRRFPEAVHLPTLHELLAPLGISFSKAAPANISLLVAIAACFVIWLLIWRTRWVKNPSPT